MNINTVFVIHFISALVMVADMVSTGSESFTQFTVIGKISAIVFCLCFALYIVYAVKGFLRKKTNGF